MASASSDMHDADEHRIASASQKTEQNYVSIEEHFTAEEYLQMPEYEKRRLKNIKNNFIALKNMGIAILLYIHDHNIYTFTAIVTFRPQIIAINLIFNKEKYLFSSSGSCAYR